MSTISFSVEDSLKRNIEKWAKQAKKSKSDLFRDMACVYDFNERLERFNNKTDKVLAELGIDSEEELYEYIDGNETYQDRLRQQRLSGRHQK